MLRSKKLEPYRLDRQLLSVEESLSGGCRMSSAQPWPIFVFPQPGLIAIIKQRKFLKMVVIISKEDSHLLKMGLAPVSLKGSFTKIVLDMDYLKHNHQF